MNWLNNILDEIKWQAQSLVWAVQDKIEMWKLNKCDSINCECDVEEVEVKPKKKKAKSKKKNKK